MNTNSLYISIVICTYNRADYIQEAMESLYNQTIAKNAYEVIVVNNNSSDNTESVCTNFIANHLDAQFYFLNEQKQGRL